MNEGVYDEVLAIESIDFLQREIRDSHKRLQNISQ